MISPPSRDARNLTTLETTGVLPVEPAQLAAIELLNRETLERLGFVLERVRFVKLGIGEWPYAVDVVVDELVGP